MIKFARSSKLAVTSLHVKRASLHSLFISNKVNMFVRFQENALKDTKINGTFIELAPYCLRINSMQREFEMKCMIVYVHKYSYIFHLKTITSIMNWFFIYIAWSNFIYCFLKILFLSSAITYEVKKCDQVLFGLKQTNTKQIELALKVL